MRYLFCSMRKISVLFLLVIVAATGFGCGSEEDRKALASLERLYGERYRFTFEGQEYLEAIARRGIVPNVEEAKEMYAVFHAFDDNNTPGRETSYMYLNVFSSGGFAFQIGPGLGVSKVPYY